MTAPSSVALPEAIDISALTAALARAREQQGARRDPPAVPRTLVRTAGRDGYVVAAMDVACGSCGDTGSAIETREDGYAVAVSCPICTRLRRAAEAITMARIPRRYINATLEATDWDRMAGALATPDGHPAWTGHAVRDLIANYVRAWEPGARGIGLTGDNWCGKTHTAAVLAFGLASRGIRVRWWDLPGLLSHLREAIGREPGPNEVLARLARVPVLILDDLGAADPGSQWIGSLYETLIHGRLGRDPQTTVVTTNLAGADLESAIGSRAMVRLMDQADWYRMERKSM